MITKIEKLITKFKPTHLLIIWIISMIGRSTFNTFSNYQISGLAEIFVNKKENIFYALLEIVAVYMIFLTFWFIQRIFGKQYRIKKANELNCKFLDLQFSMKMNSLLSTNIGKLSNSIGNYISYHIDLVEIVLWILVDFIPLIYICIQLFNKGGFIPILINFTLIVVSVFIFNKFNGSKKIERIRKTNKEVSGITIDNYMNIKTLRYLGKKDFTIKRLMKAQQNSELESVALIRKLGFTLLYLPPMISLLVNAYILRDSDLTTLIFVTHNTFGTFSELSQLASDLLDVLQNYSVAKKEVSIMYDKNEIKIKPFPEKGMKINCTFGYKENNIIFNAKNILLEKGKRYSVEGQSGQGKSSLANLIVGGLKPIEGKIDYVKTFYIHQETEILDTTLRENLCLGKYVSDETLVELLESVGLNEWFENIPNGFDTILGDRGSKVSSGQKQRINILRSILKMKEYDENTLIILDEPTSNLDDETEKLVVSLIDKYCKNTLLVITHRPLIKEICDNSIKVDGYNFIQ